MKDEEAQTAAGSTANTANGISGGAKKEGSDGSSFGGRGKYKFWALAAIILLAFWSMFTGTVTLKWSAVHLYQGSDEIDSPLHHDLDILEVEEREKMVRQMWDVYSQSKTVRLPLFWREAFEAAYEEMTGEESAVREHAISEIAKMSLVRASLKHESEPDSNTITSSSSKRKKKLQKKLAKK